MEEQQYLDLIKNIIENGTKKVGRNNAVTYNIFGHTSRYSLRNNTLPILTTKKVFTRGIIEELIWFLRGSTNANELKEKNVHIWDGHTSKEHYEACGLNDYEEGQCGPIYGWQWRRFGAEYPSTEGGVDQISNVVEQLKNNPNSRRHVVCSWNAKDLPMMVLPVCHAMFQFYIDEEGLSCQMYQRSGDVGLGVPFNITSYSILTHVIAKLIGVPAKEFIHVIGDAHIYEPHIEALKEQIKREPFDFPTLDIIKDIKSIEDVEKMIASDFKINNYKSHEKIKMKMVV